MKTKQQFYDEKILKSSLKFVIEKSFCIIQIGRKILTLTVKRIQETDKNSSVQDSCFISQIFLIQITKEK